MSCVVADVKKMHIWHGDRCQGLCGGRSAGMVYRVFVGADVQGFLHGVRSSVRVYVGAEIQV